MDLATMLGLLVAFGAMAASIAIDGGNPAALINIPSVIMVVGGTVGATMVAYPLKTFLMVPGLIMQSFKNETSDPQAKIDLFVKLADRARREGLLSLEEEVASVDDEFAKKGIMLVVDGMDPVLVRQVLEIDNDLAARRHATGIAVMGTLGAMAPAMGMVGTVIGLIGVLRNLSDPSSLGPSIAVAFLTTLYGSLLANLVFNPMGNKLKQKDKQEMISREVMVEGILAVQAGENPRIVREKLESFLTPKLRGLEKDGSAEE
ncbi:MAG: motility protein A [Anaerolineae bacterium]